MIGTIYLEPDRKSVFKGPYYSEITYSIVLKEICTTYIFKCIQY